MVDWKRVAIDDLRSYALQKDSLASTKERAESIAKRLQSPAGGGYDQEPVMCGSSTVEDRWIAGIVEKELLWEAYETTAQHIARVEHGLSVLTDDERLALELFYVRRPARYIDELCDRLCVERAAVYKIKDRALEKFTLAMFGQRYSE